MTNGGHSAIATFSGVEFSALILAGNAVEATDNIAKARTNLSIKTKWFSEEKLRISLSFDGDVMDGHKFTHL